MRLTKFTRDVFSQFGEDGVIEHIFQQIGEGQRICVEFGAGGDLDCSNTANLWTAGWTALLIEADSERADKLRGLATDTCHVYNQLIEARGEHSIDILLSQYGEVDFMSIDVDGNDYHIWKHMVSRPRVMCVEFNPTVPPHVSLYQESDPFPMGFGASLLALIELGKEKSYTFIGATQINAFFVTNDLAEPFLEYERDPLELFPLTGFTFMVTDYLGQAVATGVSPPWSIHIPYIGPPLVGSHFTVTGDSARTLDAYESKYGEIARWPQQDQPNIANPDFVGAIPGGRMGPVSARNLLRAYLASNVSLVCIAIEHVSSPDHIEWVYKEAKTHGYHARTGGGVIALFRSAK